MRSLTTRPSPGSSTATPSWISSATSARDRKTATASAATSATARPGSAKPALNMAAKLEGAAAEPLVPRRHHRPRNEDAAAQPLAVLAQLPAAQPQTINRLIQMLAVLPCPSVATKPRPGKREPPWWPSALGAVVGLGRITPRSNKP
ncbi:MAG: hypothetical protein MZU91_07000 [Desulfosudis oleivorans]|nr:hypothetical protein [Desulfosudis oleivorans]